MGIQVTKRKKPKRKKQRGKAHEHTHKDHGGNTGNDTAGKFQATLTPVETIFWKELAERLLVTYVS